MMWNMPLPVLAVGQPGRTIQRIAARHNTRAGIDAAVRGGGNIPEGIGPAVSAGRRVGAQLVLSAMIASWRCHVRRTNDVRTREHLTQSRFGRGWKARQIRPAPIQLRANCGRPLYSGVAAHNGTWSSTKQAGCEGRAIRWPQKRKRPLGRLRYPKQVSRISFWVCTKSVRCRHVLAWSSEPHPTF